MEIEEAVATLRSAGLYASGKHKMNRRILGGTEIRQPQEPDDFIRITAGVFLIYREHERWIVDLGGLGQLASYIKVSEQLQDAVEAVINFFELARFETPYNLLNGLWKLQEHGLAAEIGAARSLVVRLAPVAPVESRLQLMVAASFTSNHPCASVISVVETGWYIATPDCEFNVPPDFYTDTLAEVVDRIILICEQVAKGE